MQECLFVNDIEIGIDPGNGTLTLQNSADEDASIGGGKSATTINYPIKNSIELPGATFVGRV
jgi:hypothetical protein